MSADTVSYIVLGLLLVFGVLPLPAWIMAVQAHRREVERNEQLRKMIELLKEEMRLRKEIERQREEMRERDERLRSRTERRRLSAAMMRASVAQRAAWIPPMWMN